jgi:uncharacterized protein
VGASVLAGAPMVLLLHGLEGGIRSPYARGMLAAIAARGWRGGLLHFRGCSGEPNRRPRSYHSGETGDLDLVVRHLHEREPGLRLAVVGYSLGGNVLLKWLGERGAEAPVAAAAAVSVPFVLRDAALRLDRGGSRLYQWHLLRSLRRSLGVKYRSWVGPAPVDIEAALRCRTLMEFDDRVTAPLHGFRDAEDYYERSSSRGYLGRIRIPTLLIHAADDPFMTAAAIPAPGELAPGVRLELSPAGGHVGFVEGRMPWRAGYWLERRLPAFLGPHLEARPSQRPG